MARISFGSNYRNNWQGIPLTHFNRPLISLNYLSPIKWINNVMIIVHAWETFNLHCLASLKLIYVKVDTMGFVRVLSFFSDEAVQNVWLGDNTNTEKTTSSEIKWDKHVMFYIISSCWYYSHFKPNHLVKFSCRHAWS